MSKKDKRPYSQTKENAGNVPAQPTPPGPAAQLPKDVQEKLEAIKSKPEKLQQLQQLQNPQQPAPAVPPAPAPEDKDKIHVLVLVDDSDSKTMSKIELKDKLTAIIQTIGKEIDPNITPQTLILSELWQNCFDAKYELLQLIALSAPVYDTGMLQAIKIAEVHKTMVLKKF